MAIDPPPLDQLDPDAVAAALKETVERVQADNPHLDLRRGVFGELLAYYHAVLDTQRRASIKQYLDARSLLAIQQDPALADPDLVDHVLSNFRLDRKAGRKAAGDVTVVVSDDVTVTVGQGSVWEANGRRYLATAAFTAKVEAGQINSVSDRLLVPAGGGTYAFTIAVEAEAAGAAADVKKDTLVSPLVLPQNYVTSYATADFAPGLDAETNEDLLARLQAGIAARAMSNRVNMTAALRDVEAFSRVTAVSIVGHGDAELIRAYHSILPIALGGRCDWYVRTQEAAAAVTLPVTAVLIEIERSGAGIWQFGVGRDAAPGFYEFRDVRRADDASPAAGGYEVTEDVRGVDVSGDGFRPDVADAAEAAYSAFSVAVVRFRDTDDTGALAVGATRDYTVGAVCLPLIAEIQAHVSSRDVRPYGGDCLVKAPVPCFVDVSLAVFKKAGQADPDVAAMTAALCAAVNTTGFSGALYASTLSGVVQAYLADGQTASAVDMFGRLRYPDGTAAYLRDSEVLTVPDAPGSMVSAKTVQFFTDPARVSVSVVTRVPSAL